MRAGFKRLFLVGSLFAPLVLAITTASSASISGTKCSKLTATKTIANVKYTCVKSGKNLVWNKGVVIKKVVIPAPTPSKPEDLTAITSPVEIVQLITPATGIFYKSLYSDMDNLLAPSTPTIKINYFISDNAKLRNHQKYIESLKLASRLFYKYFNNTEVNVVFFTEADSEWIDKKQTELMGDWLKNPTQQLQSYRLSRIGCNIGGMYLPNNFVICVKNDTDRSSIYSASFMPAHEYAHIAGMISPILSTFPVGDSRRLAPCWVHEGFAQFVGMFAASHIDTNFKENRNKFFTNIQSTVYRSSRTSVISTFQEMETYGESGGEYCAKIQDAYFMGAIAFEKLSMDYGFEKVMEAYKTFYAGVTWGEAFKITFGYSTSEFYEKMADIITTYSWVA